MNKKVVFLFLLLACVLLFVFISNSRPIQNNSSPIVESKAVVQNETDKSISSDTIPKKNVNVKQISKLEIPLANANDRVIDHLGYSFLYNETHEQASWVAYELTKLETDKLYDRTNKFLCDPLVKKSIQENVPYPIKPFIRGEQVYEIPLSQLYLKSHQIYTLEKSGICIANDNEYDDVTNKANIVFHIFMH